MAINKSDFDIIDERIKKITEQAVEQIAVNSDYPPTIEQLENNNKTYSIMAAILFIDIRKSTYLTENSQTKSMVKIYRSFMRMAVDCVRKNGGVTRQFLGDRIMGVFIDSKDDKGIVTEKAVDKAINAARSLQTVVDFSLNKHLKSNVNGKIIECGIGIDYGKVLVTQVGMYGVESDDTKENEVDCVWVGSTTNYASKYSDIASGGEIFISDSVYKNLSDGYKEVWTKSAKYKGTKLFQGYVTNDYYLDFTEQLGSPIKIEEDSTVGRDTSQQLADGVREIEALQNKLIQRERELAVLEDKLKKENQELIHKCNNAENAKYRAINESEDRLSQLNSSRKQYYEFIGEMLGKAHCREREYMNKMGIGMFDKYIAKEYELGALLGKTKDEVTDYIKISLINIYNYFKRFDEAYEMIVFMANGTGQWIYFEEETLQWAKEQNKIYILYNAIERRLVNYQVKFENRKEFEGYLVKLKPLRGY